MISYYLDRIYMIMLILYLLKSYVKEYFEKFKTNMKSISFLSVINLATKLYKKYI